MTINPRDYDRNELADLAREHNIPGLNGSPDEHEDGSHAAGRAEETLRSGQYRELLLLEGIGRGRERSKPYLSRLPETYAAELLTFEWLEYLLDKAGFKRTLDALDYYESIEWLSDDVKRSLQDYLRCLDEPDPEDTVALDGADHVKSLSYAARLSLMNK